MLFAPLLPILAFLVLTIGEVTAAAETPSGVITSSAASECIKNTRQCLRNSECCSGCCQEEKCVEWSDTCTKAQSPCSYHECPNGKECYLHQVQCVQAPCQPIPACRSVDYADDYQED